MKGVTMTDKEKLAIIKMLVDTRADMAEHTILTATKFLDNSGENSSYSELYRTKITAANAVSGFCYELLEVMHNLDLKEDES